MLATVGLEDRGYHLPGELSGGQRQRVTIARALVNEPAIIWADEPTGDLDSETAADIVNLIEELNGINKQTFVVVTHSEEVGQRAHRIVRMRDGQIERDGAAYYRRDAGAGRQMKEIFGVSMNVIMATLLVIFLLAIAVVALLALRNRVMFRMGVRPITRRWGQTALIVIGVMLSTVIISAALGTGDTLSVSIRQETLDSLKTIDEVIVPTFADAGDSFGSSPFVEYERFEKLRQDVAHLDTIDGLTPQLAVVAPSVNPRTKLNEGFPERGRAGTVSTAGVRAPGDGIRR